MEFKVINYSKFIPDAYHGTNSGAAEKIIAEEQFKISRKPDLFLGDGIYFFENSEWHARDWAKRFSTRKVTGKRIVVFRAKINLGACLDIAANKEHRDFVKSIYKLLQSKTAINNLTDAVVINFIATDFAEIDTVRSFNVVPKYGQLFQNSKIYDYSQLIICVRNPNRITEFEVCYRGK